MRRKTFIVLILTALLLVLSFFMPGVTLHLRDRSLSGQDDTVPVDEVQLSLLPELDEVAKLSVAGDVSAASIPVSSGRNLTRSAAVRTADDLAMELGILPDEPGGYDLTVTPELRVSADGDALILWTAEYSSDNLDVLVIFDDSDGQCLGFSYTSYPLGRDWPVYQSTNDGTAVLEGASGEEAKSEATEAEAPASNAGSTSQEFIKEHFNIIYMLIDPLGLDLYEMAEDNGKSATATVFGYDSTCDVPIDCHAEYDGLGNMSVYHFSANMG